MKRVLLKIVFGIVLFLTFGTALQAAAGPVEYLIGLGDVLDVTVWKDDALSRQVVVLPDGLISFPLIGEVQAAEKTVSEFKKELAQRIHEFVPDPVLSVTVLQVNSLQIYVIGKVHKSGRFVLNSNVSVLQALAMAGGLDPFAKRDKIKVVRERGDDTQVFPFDYDLAVENSSFAQNITLLRGDVIVVP